MFKETVTESKRPLRINNVAKRTGVSERTLRHWAATGRLPAKRAGKKIWVFDPDAIKAFMRRRSYET